MSLSNKILLSFVVDNGCFRLFNSSENDSLDEKTSALAGINLKQIVDHLTGPKKPINDPKALQDGVFTVQLTRNELGYLLQFEDIPCLASCPIKLNEKYVQTLSGFSTKAPAAATKLPDPKKLDLEDDWVLVASSDSSNITLPPGINNPGNDCFMNAVFQIIMHDDLLRAAIVETYQNDPSPKAQALIEAINRYALRETISTNALRQFMPKGFQNGQQDASEFLSLLLNSVSVEKHGALYAKLTTTNEWEKKGWFGMVSDTKKTSVTANEFLIPIQIPKTNHLLNGTNLIQSHFAKKRHQGENYKDELSGKIYSPGHVQLTLENTPRRLVFSLNRFDDSGKINSPVEMPEIVEMQGNRYALSKIIMHHGETMGNGHYTALLRYEAGRWIHADDKTVRAVNRTTQDQKDGYIYFYELS